MLKRSCSPFVRSLPIIEPKLFVSIHTHHPVPYPNSDSSSYRPTPAITSTEDVLALISSISNSLHASQKNTLSKPSSLFAKSVFSSHKKSVGLSQTSPSFTPADPITSVSESHTLTDKLGDSQAQPSRLDLSFLDKSIFSAYKSISNKESSPGSTEQPNSVVDDQWAPLFESLSPTLINPKFDRTRSRKSHPIDTDAISHILVTAKLRSSPKSLTPALTTILSPSIPPTIKLSADDISALKAHLYQASASPHHLQLFLATLFGHVPLPPTHLVSAILARCAQNKYTHLGYAIVAQIRRTHGYYGLVSTLSAPSFLSLLQLAWSSDNSILRVIRWLRDMRALGLSPCPDMAGYLDALLMNCSAPSAVRKLKHLNLYAPTFQSLGLNAPNTNDANLLWEALCDLDWTQHLASARAFYSHVQVRSQGIPGAKNSLVQLNDVDESGLLSADSLVLLLQSTNLT